MKQFVGKLSRWEKAGAQGRESGCREGVAVWHTGSHIRLISYRWQVELGRQIGVLLEDNVESKMH